MASSLYKSKERIRSKLQHRMAILEKKFSEQSESPDKKMLTEANQIQDLLDLLNDQNDDANHKDKISVKDSVEENWYRSIAGYWLDQHIEAGVNSKQQSTIYKFALHFFVEQVVLNPQNSVLSYSSLLRKMEYLNAEDQQLENIARDLEDIKGLASFIAAMDHEVNTLPDGMSKQLTPGTFENMRSEIDKSGPYGIALQQFLKNRISDKVKSKKRGEGGIEF